MDLQVHHFTVGVMGNRILSRLSKRWKVLSLEVAFLLHEIARGR
jgi:hypothetical protein